jgi:hypothetical protein
MQAMLGHAAMSLVTLGLMVTGFVLLSAKADGFSTLAATVTGPNLEIAAGGDQTWGLDTGPAWKLSNGNPGATATGTVWLRTLKPVAPGTVMTLRALASQRTPGFADRLFITSMTLGGTDLLPRWAGCTGGGTLTVEDLVSCEELTATLPVPGTAGASFAMSVRIDPALGNAFQGATSGGVTFVFSLWGPDGGGAGSGGPGSGGPGTGAPGAGSTGAGGPGSGAPGAGSGVTPRPPATGFGPAPDEPRELIGLGLVALGLLLGCGVLGSLLVGRRPRRGGRAW